MTNKIVEKDERTTFIENVSYKMGYKFITIAIPLDVVYRWLRFHESSADLLVILILSLLPTTAYQYKQKIFPKTWIRDRTLIYAIIILLALFLAFVIKPLLNHIYGIT